MLFQHFLLYAITKLNVLDFQGHITSYYHPTLQKYTSFRTDTNPVVEILTAEDKVLSLTKNHLRCSLKRGLPVFNFK